MTKAELQLKMHGEALIQDTRARFQEGARGHVRTITRRSYSEVYNGGWSNRARNCIVDANRSVSHGASETETGTTLSAISRKRLCLCCTGVCVDAACS